MSSARRLTGFLSLRRNTALLLVALLLAPTGERLWLGFAPKYLKTLGAGVLVIGLFDALQTLLGALYAYHQLAPDRSDTSYGSSRGNEAQISSESRCC